MKKILAAIGLVVSLTTGIKAQTTNSINPIVAFFQNTAVDTNSSFWANEKIEIRAGTQTTVNKLESTLGFSYILGAPTTPTGVIYGAGAEIINGSVNAIDACYATFSYGYAYYNVKLEGFVGAGYDNVNQSPGFEVGARASAAISQNMFLAVTYDYAFDTRGFASRQQTSSARAEAGFKF